ncbi:T9SS type A sorting domain-containing protein [candidate division KSB1 bacterium]|nr:T9SS type A sorting domain-containing protein [candidate division KSB1 bacterium]
MKLLLVLIVFFSLVQVFSGHLFADVTVTITEPVEGTVFSPCEDVVFKYDFTATAGEEVNRLYLYYNGRSKGSIRSEPWEHVWKTIPRGAYEFTARLVTKDDAEFWSDPVHIRAGDVSAGELLYNGSFDCGTLGPLWRPNIGSDADAEFNLLDDGLFDENYYLSVDIYETGADAWSVQLLHAVPIDSGHTYELSFWADALSKKSIYMGMQMAVDPWTPDFSTNIEIDGFNLYGPYEFTASKTDPTNDLVFHFGGDDTPMFIDDIRVVDRSATSVKPGLSGFIGGKLSDYDLFQAYPNPFNSNTTIQFQLAAPSRISLDIFNMTGQIVKNLANGYQAEGRHSLKWDGTDGAFRVVPSGVYFYVLSVDDGSFQQEFSRKLLLIK